MTNLQREIERLFAEMQGLRYAHLIVKPKLTMPSCNTDLEDPIVQARLLATHEQNIQEAQEMDMFLESMRDSE